MTQAWPENVDLVDMHPLLHLHSHALSTSHTHSVHDLSFPLFPGELSPSHHTGLSVSPDESCSSSVTVEGLLSGQPCTPWRSCCQLSGRSCGSWGQQSHGDGMWDRAGHIQGLSQLQGRGEERWGRAQLC